MKKKQMKAFFMISAVLIILAGCFVGCKKKNEDFSATSSGGGGVDGGEGGGGGGSGGGGGGGGQAKKSFVLTVSASGSGGGKVFSSPAGIDCGSDCSESYEEGTQIKLTTFSDAFSSFSGWDGACSGSGDCSVLLDADKTVRADFKRTAFNGTWTGTTSQGFPMSFSVSDGKIKQLSFQIQVTGFYCTATVGSTVTYVSPLAIASDAFSDTSSYPKFKGTFSSASQASGTLEDYHSACWGTASVTWSATNASPSFASPDQISAVLAVSPFFDGKMVEQKMIH